jgi:prophage maintenance system killer protein
VRFALMFLFFYKVFTPSLHYHHYRLYTPPTNTTTEKRCQAPSRAQAEIFGVIKSAANIVFGRKLYPTVLHQVAFILYTLNKKHILLDGNKRFSLLLILYILRENNGNL